MIYLAAVCVIQCAVIAAALWLGARERRDHHRFVDALVEAARTERADLLQRIQAPDHAVIQHHNQQEPVQAPPAVNEFDDDDYWVSRDELADRAAAAEVKNRG